MYLYTTMDQFSGLLYQAHLVKNAAAFRAAANVLPRGLARLSGRAGVATGSVSPRFGNFVAQKGYNASKGLRSALETSGRMFDAATGVPRTARQMLQRQQPAARAIRQPNSPVDFRNNRFLTDLLK